MNGCFRAGEPKGRERTAEGIDGGKRITAATNNNYNNKNTQLTMKT